MIRNNYIRALFRADDPVVAREANRIDWALCILSALFLAGVLLWS